MEFYCYLQLPNRTTEMADTDLKKCTADKESAEYKRKLKYKKFQLCASEKILTMKLVKLWTVVLKEVVEFLTLDIFKTYLDRL